MTKYGFAINLHRCIGCRTCTVSCKMENHVAEGIARIPVYNDEGTTTLDAPSGTYPNVTFLWRPTPCQHCDEPPCVAVCPTGASSKRDDGVVVVDKETCIGCETCLQRTQLGQGGERHRQVRAVHTPSFQRRGNHHVPAVLSEPRHHRGRFGRSEFRYCQDSCGKRVRAAACGRGNRPQRVLLALGKVAR